MKASTRKFLISKNPKFYENIINGHSEMFRKVKVKNQVQYMINSQNQLRLLVSQYESEDKASLFFSHHNLMDYNRIVFVGVGTYHTIKAAYIKNPHLRYDIVFTCLDEAIVFFNEVDFNWGFLKQLDKIYVMDTEETIKSISRNIVESMTKSTLIFEHPVLKHYLFAPYELFNSAILNNVDQRKNALHINKLYEKQWIINALMNFETVLQTPCIFDLGEVFNNKDVILVAAGPSLEYELDNLKIISRDKSAYIVALGSSIKALLKYQIKPDLICTYDPSHLNIKVYEELIGSEIHDVPMLFGSTTAEEVIRKYTGPKIHFLTGQDSLYQYLLKDKNENRFFIQDAPVISILALDIFKRLNAKRLIMIGQNFAFHNEKWYAKGIDYSHFNLDINNFKNLVEMESVEGNVIFSDDSLYRSHQAMEAYLKLNPIGHLINTTRGGAKILGSEFVPLDDLMNTFIKNSIGEEWYIRDRFSYDFDDLRSSFSKLNDAYIEFKIDVAKLKESIVGLNEQVVNSSRENRIVDAYLSFDKCLRRIESNSFYVYIAMQMDRVRRDYLLKRATEVNREKNQLKRIKLMLPEYENYTASLITLVNQYGLFFDLFFKKRDIIQ